MSFFVDLWESIFTPGTTPALLKATHGSFVLLLLSLLFLVYYSGSIHFINLFIIAAILYALVIWFVAELRRVKLIDNKELLESEKVKKIDKAEPFIKPTSTTGSGTKNIESVPKKRKV